MASKAQKVFESAGTRALLPSQVIRLRDVELPVGTEWMVKLEQGSHSSSAVILLHQLGPLRNPKEVVMAEFLDQLAHQPFYDQLRTQEQLGYTVGTSTRSFEATKAFQFVVQGERHPAYVEKRIESFLQQFQHKLGNMTEEKFGEQKASFQSVLQSNRPKTLFERYQTVGKEIVSERHDFDAEVKERDALDKLTLEEFRTFFNVRIRQKE
jgi:insulysin